MRKLILGLAAATAWAAPAHATGTISCRSTSDESVTIDLVIGSLAGPVIAQARFASGARQQTTGEGGPMLMQAWLDRDALYADIGDPNGERYLVQLRANRRLGRGPYAGTLKIDDRTHQVRCVNEDEG
jgi:hypothetical protein